MILHNICVESALDEIVDYPDLNSQPGNWTPVTSGDSLGLTSIRMYMQSEVADTIAGRRRDLEQSNVRETIRQRIKDLGIGRPEPVGRHSMQK